MKCAIYIRVSKDCIEQRSSLKNQKDLFINYIKEKQWDVYDFYIDIKSGSKPHERKELNRMIEDAKNKKYDIILSKELSRLARNGKLSYAIKETAMQNNIHIVTLDGAINTLKGETDKFGLFVWLYEHEAQTIANRIKYSLSSKAKRGEFKCSTPPYGYHIENKKLVINDDETPQIVKRIFSEYIGGKGYDEIAKGLFKDKIITPSQHFGKSNASNIWHGATVRGILTNQNYTGDLVQSKTQTISVTSIKRKINTPTDYIIVESAHEPVIDKETFSIANSILSSRKKIKPKPQTHLFSNLLFCADCGKGMHFKKNRRGYICGAYDKRGNFACDSHIIREKDLINIISSELKELSYSIQKFDYSKTIQSRLNNKIAPQKKQINRYINLITKCKNKKVKYLDLLIDETLSKTDYNYSINKINEDIEKYTSEMFKLKQEINSIETKIDLKELKKIQKHLKDFSKLTPVLLHTFIEKIEIKKDGSPRIYYRFSGTSNLLSLN